MDPPEFFLILIGIAAFLGLVSMTFRFAKWDQAARAANKLRRHREQTYSEIAAYVAEGTIAPAEAERMIKAMGERDAADKVEFELDQARLKG